MELLLLDDGLLLQALATPSVSTATATVPYWPAATVCP